VLLRTALSFPFVALLAASFVMSGCGIVGGESNTPTPTSTPTVTHTATPIPPTSTPVPTETPTPEPTPTPAPQIVTSSGELAQGKTIVVNAIPRGAAVSAILGYNGKNHQMMALDTGFWLPIGAAPEAAVGPRDLVVTMFDDAGNAIQTLTSSVAIVPFGFEVEYLTVEVGGPNGLRTPEEVQVEQNIRSRVYAGFTPEQLWDGAFIIPVPGVVTTAFGTARSYNGGPPSLNHSGTDFGADEGTPVQAAASGRIAFAGSLTTRGESVIIDHGAGVFTAYHHLSRIDVAEGQSVEQGSVIGAVGMTGLATGPHLHWELVVGGVNVDPVYWTFAGVAP
jgi:murein DD-endopeptidase MepM/ murein hydrolase activator NlpD